MQMPSPPIFGLSENCFFFGNFRQKMQIWCWNPHFGEIWGKIKILSFHHLMCRKFAAVCWKIPAPPTLLTDDTTDPS